MTTQQKAAPGRQGDKTEALFLRLSPEMLAALDAVIAERGEGTRSSVAREMIAAGLKARGKR